VKTSGVAIAADSEWSAVHIYCFSSTFGQLHPNVNRDGIFKNYFSSYMLMCSANHN